MAKKQVGEEKNNSSTHVAITYCCKDCGEFEVIKSHSNLYQLCSCGLQARPMAIAYVGIRTNGKWEAYRLENK